MLNVIYTIQWRNDGHKISLNLKNRKKKRLYKIESKKRLYAMEEELQQSHLHLCIIANKIKFSKVVI